MRQLHLLVTAAGSGIGEAIVRRAVSSGAVVTAVDIQDAGIERLRDEFGADILPVRADMTVESDVADAVAQAVAAFGPIDQVHNGVGGGRGMAPIVDMRVEDWDYTIALVMRSCFLVTKHAAPQMRDGGAIVNISSINARLPHYPASSYSSSKAAIEMFTKSSALELGPRLRVNAVLPGIVRTAVTKDQIAPGSRGLRAFERTTLLGRVADPDDIAGPCLFLAGADARHITGTSLVVDAGCEIMGYPDPRDYLAGSEGCENK